jgi:hypothetical protein
VIRSALLTILGLIGLGFVPHAAHAHGGVVEEEDLCVIKVNYLRGHFKIYQPLIDGHEEYCEDLPNATETVFVMEYLHESLGDAAVDFRIIHDVTGKGRFARWQDIAGIDDLESVTVFYHEPRVDPDLLTVIHEFTEEGDYIGIITANVDGEEKIYRAVFPFEVGFTGFGYWPLFVVLILATQFQYFFMSGRFARWRARRSLPKQNVSDVLILLVMLAPFMWSGRALAEEAREWVSERGVYELSYESSLEPIEINRIHTWVLHITTAGEPVLNARLSVGGGMSAHDHGLPTRPRISEELGNGDYRLEGMRFHMRGAWEVSIEIEANGKVDTVMIALQL